MELESAAVAGSKVLCFHLLGILIIEPAAAAMLHQGFVGFYTVSTLARGALFADRVICRQLGLADTLIAVLVLRPAIGANYLTMLRCVRR